jgi:hypothetical protein
VPRFGSFLRARRADALGYRYDVNERMPLRFDHFLQSLAELAGNR